MKHCRSCSFSYVNASADTDSYPLVPAIGAQGNASNIQVNQKSKGKGGVCRFDGHDSCPRKARQNTSLPGISNLSALFRVKIIENFLAVQIRRAIKPGSFGDTLESSII